MLSHASLGVPTNRSVDEIVRRKLCGRIKCEEQLHVREASLLKFDLVHSCNRSPKDLLVFQLVNQLLDLSLKDSGNDIRAILRLLPRKQVLEDVWILCT